MCGVFGSLGATDARNAAGWKALAHRGPDAAAAAPIGDDLFLAHTRLAIQDLDRRSDQPFRRGDVTLSYNGELWNASEVRKALRAKKWTFETTGDTEVVATALAEWGAGALPRLQGMFGMAWADGSGALWAARDRFGEVPLHYHYAAPLMVASEVKALLAAGAEPRAVRWVPPGGLLRAEGGRLSVSRWYDAEVRPEDPGLPAASASIGALVAAGARERAVGDVPACALLSGGIDSAAVVLELRRHLPGLVAYVAVMDPRSRDARAARLVAEALEVELREVVVTAPSDDDLRSVVRAIEMPHKAQVEIGWACLALARRMRDDGFKVTFSGEGSDELWASYGFAYHGLKTKDWHAYRKDLFVGQHRKNFARCNKVFMAHGVECRLPFLSTPLVEKALSLARGSVQDGSSRPKAVLQRAYRGLLPDEVTGRPKLAFQDGLGLKKAIEAARGDAAELYRRAFDEAFPGVEP
jgi:asparagine synthase (glutamine-hydrolysing)